MEKERVNRGVLIVSMGLLVAFAGIHTYLVLHGSSTQANVSGNAVAGNLFNVKGTSTKTKLIIASEWMLIVVVMLYSLIKAKNKFKKEEKVSEEAITTPLVKTKNRTDIDMLYELLMTKKSLQLATIAKYFRVDKNIAMSWCRILEEGNLGIIHYPAVGDPKIVLVEINETDEKTKTPTKN